MKNKKKFAASSSNNQPIPVVDLEKIFGRRARYSCDYTCTFCFRTFSSAQSFGGHQNAHQAERKEEKRLHVKHLNFHRKQLFLRSLHPQGVPSVALPPQTQPQLHVQGPSKAVSAGNGRNRHGNQHEPKSSPSLDLNLPYANIQGRLPIYTATNL